jgi:curved DNA-binding protein CbpA
MNLEQGYTILGLEHGDDLDKVKSAYRHLAFLYHPDLNPDDPRSARKFQQLNEAFVLVRRHLEAEQPAEGEHPLGEDAEPADQAFFRDARKRSFFLRKEEILRDVLKDPFARKVFEDIYQEARRTRVRQSLGSHDGNRERNLGFGVGRRRIRIDLRNGIWQSVKGWFRRQMDDEQVVYMPRMKLIPGTRVLLNVRHRWSGPARSLELTVPPDYVPGRPIRLKGLGRRIGPWKGDLYLRLLTKPER